MRKKASKIDVRDRELPETDDEQASKYNDWQHKYPVNPHNPMIEVPGEKEENLCDALKMINWVLEVNQTDFVFDSGLSLTLTMAELKIWKCIQLHLQQIYKIANQEEHSEVPLRDEFFVIQKPRGDHRYDTPLPSPPEDDAEIYYQLTKAVNQVEGDNVEILVCTEFDPSPHFETMKRLK